MRTRLGILAAAALATVTALLIAWILPMPRPANRTAKPAAQSLDRLRPQFPRADGSLRTHEELVAVLQAKGIPYLDPAQCLQGAACGVPGGQSHAPAAPIPEIRFEDARLSEEAQEKIRLAVADVLPAQIENARRIAAGLRLISVSVDSRSRLNLYFNRDFSAVADDETALNDFSESLHSLGLSGLKGSVLYIDGEPLGAYLRRKDEARNREVAPSADNRPTTR